MVRQERLAEARHTQTERDQQINEWTRISEENTHKVKEYLVQEGLARKNKAIDPRDNDVPEDIKLCINPDGAQEEAGYKAANPDAMPFEGAVSNDTLLSYSIYYGLTKVVTLLVESPKTPKYDQRDTIGDTILLQAIRYAQGSQWSDEARTHFGSLAKTLLHVAPKLLTLSNSKTQANVFHGLCSRLRITQGDMRSSYKMLLNFCLNLMFESPRATILEASAQFSKQPKDQTWNVSCPPRDLLIKDDQSMWDAHKIIQAIIASK